MDNYYTSVPLFQFLVTMKTYACGTVRSNRRFLPKAFAEAKKMKEQEVCVRRKKELLAIKYEDKRSVHMLSTIHDAKGRIVIKQKRPERMKPTAILDYCSKMGGVDLMDQVSQYYEITRKSMKWWRKLSFYLIDLCIVNAYQLYRKFGTDTRKLTHSEFRLALVKALASSAQPRTPRAKNIQETRDEVPMRLRCLEMHFSDYIPKAPGSKSTRKHAQRDCFVCNVSSAKRSGFKRVQTCHWCEQCQVPLCYPTCFKLYHKYKDFKQQAWALKIGAYASVSQNWSCQT